MRYAWGSATDVGRVRQENQDNLLAREGVWAVADGMGGHRGGEVASAMSVEIVDEEYREHATLDALHLAADRANAAIWRRAAEEPDLRGMGTTLVAIAPVDAAPPADGDEAPDGEAGPLLAWINIGDSRLYLFRDGDLEQLSEDHSLVEEMVRDGRLAPEDARTHPQRNILTRALGIDRFALIDGGTVIPYLGDRFLLCSDGLFNEVDTPRISSTLRRLADPGEAARELVRLANDSGGRDNITVVVVDVLDDDDQAARASAGIGAGTAEGHADARPATAAAPMAISGEGKVRRRDRPKGPRRLTLRVVLFSLVVVALLGGGLWEVHHVARDGYTVRLRGSDQHVVVWRGNGRRVLWYEPAVAGNGDLGALKVVEAKRSQATEGRSFGSYDCAVAFAQQLGDNRSFDDPCQAPPATTTTTTSTTTSTSTTTVPVAVPAPVN